MISKDDAFTLKGTRHKQVIKDPFPEHTRWEQFGSFFAPFRKPKRISPHKAYMVGYLKAYEEINGAIDALTEKL